VYFSGAKLNIATRGIGNPNTTYGADLSAPWEGF
jgi:hypothetical protein